MDSAGRRGTRTSRAPKGPGRGVVGPQREGCGCGRGAGLHGRAAASVPWLGKPGNQAVSLTSSCSLQRLPIGQTRREARVKGPLEEATWVREQGPEGDGRAREWKGGYANWLAAQALLHSPPAGSLRRHVQSPCERNHKTLLQGTKKTQNRKVRTFQHHQDVSSL